VPGDFGVPAAFGGVVAEGGDVSELGQVKHATAFLQWLSGHDLALPACRQADIDAWHAEHNEHGRNTIRAQSLAGKDAA
jgi:hypothetical protein